jgi:hypothetical protein
LATAAPKAATALPEHAKIPGAGPGGGGGCVMKSVQVSAALAITGILILGISGGYAQSNLASVSGVVSDPQGLSFRQRRSGLLVPA